jgi:23S rRNA pseudouridine955/2504/2580 synthase
MLNNIENKQKNMQISEASSTNLVVDEASEGQRIDNFLQKMLKGVPKSHIYRILRSGEVRVNKKRITADFRLSLEDVVRVPPIRIAEVKPASTLPVQTKFDQAIVYEDDAMLVINKPSGFAVHGGSGVSRGVIEQLRMERPQAKFLELVHRLDRDTSGVLMLAKKTQCVSGVA